MIRDVHPGSCPKFHASRIQGSKGTGSRIRSRNTAAMFRNTYITPYTSNHWNSIPPLFLIVQPAEELGLIDGIDQVEAYIQRNYGDQARTVYYCCCFWDKLFLFTDSLFKKEYLMEKPLLTFSKKWLPWNGFLTILSYLTWQIKVRFVNFVQKVKFISFGVLSGEYATLLFRYRTLFWVRYSSNMFCLMLHSNSTVYAIMKEKHFSRLFFLHFSFLQVLSSEMDQARSGLIRRLFIIIISPAAHPVGSF